jgi:hypothetical protein
VITNENGDIAYVHGRAGAYLEPSAGEPRSNIFAMARDGLPQELRPALRLATREDGEVERSGVRVRTDDGGARAVNLIVKRLTDPEAVRGLLRVSFEPARPAESRKRRSHAPGDPTAAIEQELQGAKDTLRSAVADLETSNQDLRSANEELQSMNEELQSANEELETSKEELKSLNE